MRTYTLSLAICLIGFMQANSLGQAPVDKAYQHLYKIMDKYHTTLDVYTDRDGGGNRFYPALIGNWSAIDLRDNYNDDSTRGATSIRISYPTLPVGEKDWAGVQWMFPDTNWGYWLGQDLHGATNLTFLARGEKGEEKIEFKLGGVNRPPHRVIGRPYMDSADLLSTGLITLSKDWKEYSIDLTTSSNFAVYLDGDAGSNNRYIPSGWMNGSANMQVDPNWQRKPHSGSSCFRVEWNGMSGTDGYKWNGIMWQYPEGNWNTSDGHDLTNATKINFWARTDEPGVQLKFQVGNRFDSSGEVITQWLTIDTTWKAYTIDLKGKSLKNVRGGFAFVFDNVHDPNPDGTVFYLDDITFDKPVSKDLSNVIAGFICAVSKADNPAGCTFYLDNIRYALSDERRFQRLREPHFLESYITKNEKTFDQVLRNTAFLYDNALVLLAFLQRRTPEDLWRADVLANTFIYCQNYDYDFQGQRADYRLRNAYRSGDLIEPNEGWARFSSYYDDSLKITREDPGNRGSSTGNLAWSMIALLNYAKVRNSNDALQAAKRLGDWILKYNKAIDQKQGFFGGVEYLGGGGYVRVPWKSTEHNLDAYVAFSLLFDATRDTVWSNAAKHSLSFINSMYNNQGPYFWIGTIDATQINESPLVEDVQTWGLMVLRDRFYRPIIKWVLDNCRVQADGFDGIDFDTDRDGVWFEGTAHLALALWMANDSLNYIHFVDQLRKAQVQAINTDGLGIVAASHDGVTTGLNWKYYNRLHIGATAWYIFAETKWNPYWQVYVPLAIKNARPDFMPRSFDLSQNFPNPFNPSTQLRISLPKNEHVSLKIYSPDGRLIRTLFDTRLAGGEYSVNWDGRAEDGALVTSGVYFAIIRAGDWVKSRKLVLMR